MRFWTMLSGLLLVLASAATAHADTPLFASETPIAFALDAPFGRIVSRAKFSLDPTPASLRLTVGGPAQTFPVQINPRGQSRRVGGFCSFPPLALTFADGSVHDTLFAGQDKVKLVSVCRPGVHEHEQNLVKEYLAYKLYNTLTPVSFRVRPADVTYHEAGTDRAEAPRFAFLIESTDDMAHRNQRAELKTESHTIGYDQFDGAALTRVALFQFMIGNLDWDFIGGVRGEQCCHNMKVLTVGTATTALVPTPYDFDYSGFVNAPYAVPPADIRVSSVRTRYFRGLCRFRAELPAAIALFRAHRDEMAALVANEPRLDEKNKREAGAYLDSFFSVLDHPPQADRALTGKCDS